MGKISTQELAGVLVERWHIGKKEASQFVNELFFLIQKSLNEDKIGTFKIIDVDDRESVNVNTGDRVLIEGHGKITFTPDPLMKELVNKPFSQFETVVLKDGIDFNEAEETNQPDVAAVPDETDDNAAPLVEFVTEEEPVKPEKPEISEKSENSEKSDSSENSENSASTESVATKETPSKESETVNENVPSDENVSSEENVTTDESAAPEDEDATVVVEEEESAFKKYWKWIGIAVLTLAVGILIGYLMGNRSNTPPASEQSVEVVDSETVKALPNASDTIVADSLEVESEDLEEEDSEEDSEEDVEEEEVPQQEVAHTDKTSEATTEERQLDKWEAMDTRVKTGAYRILGTDTVLKAKAGDNLTRICNRTIGPGMECYLEVYNGISSGTALKAGQEIKIPKLELKKKKKK